MRYAVIAAMWDDWRRRAEYEAAERQRRQDEEDRRAAVKAMKDRILKPHVRVKAGRALS